MRWHRNTSEFFSGTQVITNFYNGIQVKASNMKLFQMDVKSAFLNGLINELVFVE